MSALGTGALILVLLWLAATFFYQLSAYQTTLGRLDGLRLLPSFSFFAPRPACRDDHLAIRYVFSNGRVGDWRNVSFFPRRSLLGLVWNPAKRRRKVLRDAAKSVRHMGGRSLSKSAVQCSLPYLLLLHYAIRTGKPPEGALAIQFALIETSGRVRRRLWIRFISDLHPL